MRFFHKLATLLGFHSPYTLRDAYAEGQKAARNARVASEMIRYPCYICETENPFLEMIRLTSEHWICQKCDTKTRLIHCGACGEKVDRTQIQWHAKEPICQPCSVKPITAKVAKVIDNHNLVLNVGEEQGVRKEMRFHVYALDADNGAVIDPDTSERLGYRIPVSTGRNLSRV